MRTTINKLLCITLLLITTPLYALIEPFWSTGVAVPGEQVILYLIDKDCNNKPFQTTKPQIKNASVKLLQPKMGTNPYNNDGSICQITPILIIPDGSGKIEVGQVEVNYQDGRTELVKVPSLPVASTSDIKWYDEPTRYGVLWYLDNQSPYVHESIGANIKLFLPENVAAANLPQFHSVGAKVSAFDLCTSGLIGLVHERIINQPRAQADGQYWVTEDFKGFITPYSDDKASISGSIIVQEQQGFFSAGSAEIALPNLDIKPLSLPPGAPSGFQDLVGNYTITTKTEAKSLSMNEVVDVEIQVMGTGDMSNLPAPKPQDDKAWKLIPSKGKPILDVSGKCIGMLYHQLMRPTQELDNIPAFGFVYFDPQSQEYQHAKSKPIPLVWQKSAIVGNGLHHMQQQAEPPPAGSIPVSEMTDIYNTLPQEIDTYHRPLPYWLYCLLYLPAIILLGRLVIMRYLKHHQSGKQMRDQERELSSLAKIDDSLSFLKSAGAFVESKLSEEARQSPEIQVLLRRRDEEVFRPHATSSLSAQERKDIVQQLRRLINKSAKIMKKNLPLLMIGCIIALIFNAEASSIKELNEQAVKAYDGGQYSQALQLNNEALQGIHVEAQQLGTTNAPRIYFDLGNAYYRLGEEGKAALSYARALYANPDLKEARANLDFIQRKQGAIIAPTSRKDDVFTYLSVPELTKLSIICSAFLLLMIALMIQRRGKTGFAIKLGSYASLLLCLLCASNAIYYYSLDTFNIHTLPANQIAYATSASSARSAADDKGSIITKIPAGTTLIILAHRLNWDYVECLNGTRGWVASKDIEKLIP